MYCCSVYVALRCVLVSVCCVIKNGVECNGNLYIVDWKSVMHYVDEMKCVKVSESLFIFHERVQLMKEIKCRQYGNEWN